MRFNSTSGLLEEEDSDNSTTFILYSLVMGFAVPLRFGCEAFRLLSFRYILGLFLQSDIVLLCNGAEETEECWAEKQIKREKVIIRYYSLLVKRGRLDF